MKVNELRIGDWIFSIENQSYQRIMSLGVDFITFDSITYDYPTINEIKPIPLTEEILLKCGFEKEGSTVYINIGSIEIGTVANGKRFYIQISYQNITLEIKHLHQLQNLYFALTNNELKINL